MDMITPLPNDIISAIIDCCDYASARMLSNVCNIFRQKQFKYEQSGCALYEAAKLNYFNIYRYLIECGTIYRKQHEYMFAKHGNLEAITYINDRGLTTWRTTSGAIFSGHINILTAFNAGGPIKFQGIGGLDDYAPILDWIKSANNFIYITEVMLKAIRGDDIKLFLALIDRGLDLPINCDEAANNCSIQILEYLVQRGIKCNKLSFVKYFGRTGVINILLNNFAVQDLPNSIIKYAIKFGTSETIKLAESAGCNLINAMHYVIDNEMYDYLVTIGLHPTNATLELAIKSENMYIIDRCIESKVKIYDEDINEVMAADIETMIKIIEFAGHAGDYQYIFNGDHNLIIPKLEYLHKFGRGDNNLLCSVKNISTLDWMLSHGYELTKCVIIVFGQTRNDLLIHLINNGTLDVINLFHQARINNHYCWLKYLCENYVIPQTTIGVHHISTTELLILHGFTCSAESIIDCIYNDYFDKLRMILTAKHIMPDNIDHILAHNPRANEVFKSVMGAKNNSNH